MYGDVSFTCPALQFASMLGKSGVDVHYFRNNIIDPVELAAGYEVPHTWEVQAVWGPEYATNYVALPGANSYDIGGINRNAVSEVQNLWFRFVTSGGSFNSSHSSVGTLAWSSFSKEQQRLRLQTNVSTMEAVSETEFERCAFWASIASRTLI
jgi:acetylcholinesterase